MEPDMKRTILLILSLGLLLSSITTKAEDKKSTTIPRGWIIQQMRDYQIPAANIAVIKNYHIQWATAFGYKNKQTKEKATVNTLFQAASISKPIAAVAAMIAFKQKKLSLDSDVNAFLKDWKIPSNPYTKNHPVTMRLLLDHTAGVAGFRFKGYPQHTKVPSLLDVLNGKSPANTPPIVVVRQPGLQYEYSPAGYVVIQAILTDLYQRPFEQVMQQLILNPFDMTNSSFAHLLTAKQKSHLAIPYLPSGKPLPNGPYTFVASAAGGLWTTATDLAKFTIAFQKALAGQKQGLVTTALAKSILRPQINHNMGLGFEINIDKYGQRVKKGSGNYFMHTGWNTGYLALLIGSRTGGNGLVIMTNSSPYMTYKGKVQQFEFLINVTKKIADLESWR
jgi:CubicO group peptidase (beta-lactamase class C family)